jgi:hypothetical protein
MDFQRHISVEDSGDGSTVRHFHIEKAEKSV